MIFTEKEEKLRETRKSGIDIIGNVPWGTHFCQFYQTKKDLIDILVPYFKAGLENNEFCIWVASEPLKVEDAKMALRKAVKNFDDCIKKGQMKILDFSKWYAKSGKFEADKVLDGWTEIEKQAFKKGFDGLRLSGNTFWLEKKDWKNFTEYEGEVNNAIGEHRMIAICTYFLDKYMASEIIDVIKNHQFVLIKQDGEWKTIESSERKKAEEKIKYQAYLLDNVNDAVMSTDMDGKIVSWNKSAEKIFGWKEEEIEGKPVFPTIIPEDEFAKLRECTQKVLSKGNWKGEFIEIKKDGTRFPCFVSISIIKDKNNKPVGMICVDSDITEIKNLEKEKKKLSEKVAKLTKKIPLTDNEKLVFYGLVKYPLYNDQQLSEKLDIKRSTITAIKNKLLKQGFYSTYAIPNFELIGCELMGIISSKNAMLGGGEDGND